jgi:hypothetical protein
MEERIFFRLTLFILLSIAFTHCGQKNPEHGKPRSITALNDSSSEFVFGSDLPPPLSPPGPGAGTWNSESKTYDNIAIAKAAKVFLKTSPAREKYGYETAETFHHYFENTGTDFPVDLSKLLKAVPRVEKLYTAKVQRLMATTQSLEAGTYKFTSRNSTETSIERSEDENWYLAVAGFSYWISGTVEVDTDKKISATVNYHLWDRYDWDPGVTIPIPTPFGVVDVDQERVGEFHRQGLAKEFSTVAKLTINIK